MSSIDQAAGKNTCPRGDNQCTGKSKGEFDPRPAKVSFPAHQHCREQIKDARPSNGFSNSEAPNLRILPHVDLFGRMKLCNCSPEQVADVQSAPQWLSWLSVRMTASH